MFKSLHAADIHLGASHQPTIYREQALPKLIAAARKYGVRHILIVGDIFDKAQPNQKTKDYLLEQIVNAQDIFFAITIGNHDYDNKAKNYHSLMTYCILGKNLANVAVCEVGVHDFSEFTLVVLPDVWKRRPSATPGVFPLVRDVPIIAAWHGMLPQSNPKEEIADVLELTGANYLALGDLHIHRQMTERCWYPGALTQKTYACQDGYVLVEISGQKIRTTSRHLDLPKRFNLSIGFDTKMDTAESVIEAVRREVPKGNLVRLSFELPLSQWSLLNRKKIVEELSADYLEVKLHNEAAPENTVREWAKKVEGCKNIHDEIKVIVDIEETQLDKKEILKRCENYLNG